MHGPSSSKTNPNQQFAPVPIEESDFDSETDQDSSILEVPAWNWAGYDEVKSVQYVKMGHAPIIAAKDENNWDPEQHKS